MPGSPVHFDPNPDKMLSFLPGPEYHLNNTEVQDYKTGQVLYLDPDFIRIMCSYSFRPSLLFSFFSFLTNLQIQFPIKKRTKKGQVSKKVVEILELVLVNFKLEINFKVRVEKKEA